MIRLRPLEPEDLALLYTIENDPALWNTTNGEGPYSRYALKQYIASAASIYECGALRLVIEHDATPIGLIDLTNFSPLHARAEVGIALLKAHQGKGYGTAAIALLERHAAQNLRLHTLHAIVCETNHASLAAFRKAHFTPIATLPDWLHADGRYHAAILLQKNLIVPNKVEIVRHS